MEKMAKFEKVSRERFSKDAGEKGGEESYGKISLPVRATAGSAGYDLKTPYPIRLDPGESIMVYTGLRCRIAEGWTMLIVPKSGLGAKYRVQLNNSTGVIDSDYYYAENEGHIMVPIINDSRNGDTVEIEAGKAFVQAIFVPFGITEDDCAKGIRNGGFGSTES